jgi:hypothetical protein
MATFTKIASITVGAGGTSGMDFTSIPSTYTDLCLFVSVRTGYSALYQDVPIYFNNNGSGYTLRRLYSDGSTVASNTTTGGGSTVAGALGNSATSTSNTFSNCVVYISNYAGSNSKSYSIDNVTENNSTANFQDLQAGLWANSSAINQIAVSGAGQTILQYSTATLYGVKN